jgi:hypothetical protein
VGRLFACAEQGLWAPLPGVRRRAHRNTRVKDSCRTWRGHRPPSLLAALRGGVNLSKINGVVLLLVAEPPLNFRYNLLHPLLPKQTSRGAFLRAQNRARGRPCQVCAGAPTVLHVLGTAVAPGGVTGRPPRRPRCGVA